MGLANLTATADTTVQNNLFTTAVAATETSYSLTINTVAVYSSYNATTNGAVTADQLVAAVNANSATTGVTASYDSTNTRVTFTASDGRSGIDKANDLCPDVVVLDLAMPRVDGWTVLKQLRESSWTEQIPIVVITAVIELLYSGAEIKRPS